MEAIKVAYLVSHPIQYQTPVLAALAKSPFIDLRVYFCSDMGSASYFDPEFGQEVAWDIPLLEGYAYEFLPAIGDASKATAFSPINYGLLSRLKKNGTQLLWVHGYARAFNVISILFAKLSGIQVVLRDDVTEVSRRRSGLKRFLKSIFFFFLEKLLARVMTVGTMNASFFRNNGFPEEKLTTIPYAIATDFFTSSADKAAKTREQLRDSLGLEPGRPVILYAGKLLDIKAPDHLLEAFLSLSKRENSNEEAYLVFVGEGPLRTEMEQRVEEAGVGNVVFAGFKNQTELPAFYDLCDVLVLPSLHETWGLVVNEAMCAGCAVVTSQNVGCSADLIQEGENGYTFPAGDIEALRTTLEGMLSDRNAVEEMGRKSREMIEGFSVAVTAEMFAEKFKETVAGS